MYFPSTGTVQKTKIPFYQSHEDPPTFNLSQLDKHFPVAQRVGVGNPTPSVMQADGNFHYQSVPVEDNVHVIPQLDGVDDNVSPFPSSSSINGRVFSVPDGASIDHAQFRLNPKKQLKKLKQDSFLNDFDITVSPAEHSVSIICSTGFYTLVAIPAFSHTTIGTTNIVGDIMVHCYDIAGKVDDVGSTVNARMFYRFTRQNDKTSAGGVTIHLHHTARRVQIQGNTMVTSKSRACVWFVENFLLTRFKLEARSKSFDIERFNTAVSNLVSNHVEKISNMEKCEGCSGHFIGRSVPEQCRICLQKYHKKCFQTEVHPCMVPPTSLSHTVPVTSVSAGTGQMIVRSVAQFSNTRTSTSLATSTTTCTSATTSHTATPLVSSRCLVTVVPPSLPPDIRRHTANYKPTVQPVTPDTSQPYTITTSPPRSFSASSAQSGFPSNSITTIPLATSTVQSCIQPSPTLQQVTAISDPAPGPSTVNNSQPKNGKAKSKQSNIATTKDAIALEYSRIEVNTIKARIKALETKNKDLEYQNTLLLERLSVLDKAEKDYIYDKYFPKPGVTPSDTNPTNLSSSKYHHSHCCGQRYHCCQEVSRPQYEVPLHQGETLSTLEKSLEDIKADLAVLKAKFANLDVPCPASSFQGDTVKLTAQESPANNDISSDDSVVTVDDNVGDIEDEAVPLNFQAQTIQLL